jgi:hypothetical protein
METAFNEDRFLEEMDDIGVTPNLISEETLK